MAPLPDCDAAKRLSHPSATSAGASYAAALSRLPRCCVRRARIAAKWDGHYAFPPIPTPEANEEYWHRADAAVRSRCE
eukprot:4830227-Pleurochrysis_carterae.AAC.1